MAKTVAIGVQDFAYLIENDCFYIDKTAFIKEWWNSGDSVTLITRPRRFGKTITMNMLDYFFSLKHADRSDLFENLRIWEDETFRKLQGTYPVIFLTFAGVKGKSYEDTVRTINYAIVKLFSQYEYLLDYEGLSEQERKQFGDIRVDMDEIQAGLALNLLSSLLEKYHGKKVLIFLDEYDTPLQEAYIQGYWDEMTAFIRSMFNNTFKTNSSLERAIMTGITRVSKESIFSDLNNLEVVTTTTDKYATAFGFTQEEVCRAVEEQGFDDRIEEDVKFWYDGFTFGTHTDIYNPWSIINFLDKGKFDTYWANTSGNGLVGKLIREADKGIKTDFESLMNGGYIEEKIDEQIVFEQLSGSRKAIWSLLLASGYLKVMKVSFSNISKPSYQLALTNHEVKCMFESLIEGWFEQSDDFSQFVCAMFSGDVRSMNHYMNRVALNTFSYFDTGNKPSGKEPERFYHGFVLGLLVDKAENYLVKSNRESGFGRYDVVMEPKDIKDAAVIMEFKVFDSQDGEKSLEDTAKNALKQINEKKYDTDLLQRGIAASNILKYGFAFEGEKCLIVKEPEEEQMKQQIKTGNRISNHPDHPGVRPAG